MSRGVRLYYIGEGAKTVVRNLPLIGILSWLAFVIGASYSAYQINPNFRDIVHEAYLGTVGKVTQRFAHSASSPALTLPAELQAPGKGPGHWTPNPRVTLIYVIQKGDTVNRIAQATAKAHDAQCEEDWIYTANPGLNVHGLVPKHTLIVPYRKWGGCDDRGVCLDH